MTRFLIILIAVCLACTAGAATLYVSTNNGASSTPPYDTWATAATNIQNAVFAATNDVVLVTNGTYTCASSLSDSYRAMIVITNSVTLQSVNGPAVTIVDGGNTGEFTNRCFFISNVNAVVSGFTITNGRAYADAPNSQGGGVFIGGFGTVTNCRILGNSTSNASPAGTEWGGGGVYMNNGGVVRNCLIAGNTATNYGGGVFNKAGLMQDCVISNNRAIGWICLGGGLFLSSGTTVWCTITENIVSNQTVVGLISAGGGVYIDGGVLSNSIIANNTAIAGAGGGWYGGGIMMRLGRVSNCNIFSNSIWSAGCGGGIHIIGTLSGSIVENCTISHNVAEPYYGGGIYIVDGGYVRNCLIRNNRAADAGGIRFCSGPGVTQRVENCTIVSNRASGSGGGVYLYDTTANIQIVNSIVYSNTSGTVGYDNWRTNICANGNFSNCCVIPTNSDYGVLPGANNITNYPVFIDPMANYRLTNNSPCINRGTNQDWMTTGVDLDGRSRIDRFQSQWIVDIGAYEFLPSGTMVSFH